VVPVFNAERTLRRCVESVQVAGCDEVLLVDDGSGDTTAAMLDELAVAGHTVLRHAFNRGPAAARNRGARAATSDWLIFLDADDVLDPDALRVFSEHIEEHRALVRARFSRMDDPSRRARPGFLAGTFAVRRDLFDAAGGYDQHLRYAENSELLVRLEATLTRLGLTYSEAAEATVAIESSGESRNYDENRFEAAIRILEVHGDRLTGAERGRYQAIASVNAARTGRSREARAYAWRAVRNDPRNHRHLARFTAFSFGSLGQSAWLARRSAESPRPSGEKP